ncbi:hypothetical protein C0Q70_12072 [Pomacea canaliculata]|uniref:Ig-like domain-containing protein n=1 Tax=Pomacea canaliculata TaxID=400727 RepID=A0A2T7P0I1_POMCA|nr:hypothetical protein C0Q70_12072 [Pomacea canaliculata]
MTRLLCMDAARFIGLALQSAAMSGFVAVMFMFPLCAGQPWEVEIHPKREKYTFDVTKDNAGVSLQCSLGNTSSPSLEWYDGQGKIIPAIHSGDSNPRRIVFRRTNYVELKFLAPETELNSGNYTCRGSGADGVVKEKTIQLILYKGIQLTSPTRQFAMYGQDALLNCSSSASFPRETNWFFYNWTALEGARYRKEYDYVIIANFSRADEGIYRCSIRLHEIGDSKDYELHLLAAAVKSTCEVNITDQQSFALLTCRFSEPVKDFVLELKRSADGNKQTLGLCSTKSSLRLNSYYILIPNKEESFHSTSLGILSGADSPQGNYSSIHMAASDPNLEVHVCHLSSWKRLTERASPAVRLSTCTVEVVEEGAVHVLSCSFPSETSSYLVELSFSTGSNTVDQKTADAVISRCSLPPVDRDNRNNKNEIITQTPADVSDAAPEDNPHILLHRQNALKPRDSTSHTLPPFDLQTNLNSLASDSSSVSSSLSSPSQRSSLPLSSEASSSYLHPVSEVSIMVDVDLNVRARQRALYQVLDCGYVDFKVYEALPKPCSPRLQRAARKMETNHNRWSQ